VYVIRAYSIDEYCRLGKNITMECFKKVYSNNNSHFLAMYLREPTRARIEKQLLFDASKAFLGIFENFCMNYQWKNHPINCKVNSKRKMDRHPSY
jgi:hypothetical protein